MSWGKIDQRRVRWAVGLALVGQLVLATAVAWAPATAPPPPLTIAVVGDQNTAGIKNRVVWPTLMAARTGWAVSNYALPEAGFAADGMGDKPSAFRSIARKRSAPDSSCW